ncbi:MAG TPA: TonB-dependent receptor, partial [Bryobacteraceae bacterium]|nr:TonB-dependent receptor [Bryobacteraceae bacterium]
QGIGGFNLDTRAYNRTSSESTVQITETAVLSPKAINETRFQFMHSNLANTGNNTIPVISVQDAFTGGGAQIGNSGNNQNRWELTNTTTYTRGTHTLHVGGRVRQSFNNDISVNNFGGAFTFQGGTGPQLDANNQPIAGTSIDITALERYRRTLLFEQAGLSGPAIRALGGGASQFTLSAGIPGISVGQFDIGMFYNDDWRARQNLTISYGLRDETQTNIHDYSDWAPRVGVAWGVRGSQAKPAKTVLRAGFGVFYDRIGDSVTLQSERFNGLTQQSFFILNPDFFPTIPSLSSLNALPQQLQLKYSGLRAPRTYQASLGMDRQINKYARFSVQYVESRGVHLQNIRNINTPILGAFPFGDQQLRELTETAGYSRQHMLFVNPNINYKKLFLFGFYGLSYGKSNNEGMPANPYNLRAEWGPSSFGDIRHRAVLGTNLPLPWKISVSPFLAASSGAPYNITTGIDTLQSGAATERPALVTGIAADSCKSGGLVYANGFGCFNLNPSPGTPTISRNLGRGPAIVTLNARLARTWSFGNRAETAGGPGGMMKGGGPGGPMMIIMGGPGGGGPPKKYNLTASVSALNVLNHPNYAAPNGDLTSPFFGQSLSLGGGFGPGGAGSTYLRKIDLQVRFSF